MIQQRLYFGESASYVAEMNRHSQLPRNLGGGKQTAHRLTGITLIGFDHHCVLPPRALEGGDDVSKFAPIVG